MFSVLLTLYLHSANDFTSKCYYTSVILFLLHGFITCLHCVLCDNIPYVFIQYILYFWSSGYYILVIDFTNEFSGLNP